MRRCVCVAATVVMFAARSSVGQASGTGAYVVERSESHVRFEANGTGAFRLSARLHILTEAAVEVFGQLEFAYASANERLSVDSVKVHKAGGAVVRARNSDVQDLTGPVARIAPVYSDVRQKVVTVPDLRPGDTLEYFVTWTTHTPLAPGQFWREYTFGQDVAILDERLTVDVPRERHVLVKSVRIAADSQSMGDRRVYRWQHSNLAVDTAAIRRGTLKPRSVFVTTFKAWEDVARWYDDLARARAAPTGRIRAVADSLVRGQQTLLDSVAAVYRFVAAEFRYVSLSFGVGRYQPHAAADVLANRYGDCKDKHVLLEALLGAIGVRAEAVLISSADEVEPGVPSPSQFDHMITLATTARDSVWLDATPAVAPFRLLAPTLRNKDALVVSRTGPARLVRTPAEPPFAAYDSVAVVGDISDLGGVTADVKYVLRGDIEVLWREILRQVPRESWTEFATHLAQTAGLRGTVTDAQGGTPTATEQPFEFGFRLDRSSPAKWVERRASLRLPLPIMLLGDTSGPDSLPLGPPTRHVGQTTLQVAPGITVRLPLPVTAKRDWAEYRATYALDGRTLTARRELLIKQASLPPSLKADFAALREIVRDDEAQMVTLVRATDAPPAALSGNVDELHKRGLAALDDRDGPAALRLFREVVRLAPEHRNGWSNLGRAWMALERPDSAAVAFRRQLALTPSDVVAHNSLGWSLWRSQRLDSAAAVFERSLELSPLDGYAHGSLGRVYLEMNRDSAAVASLERATKVDEDDASLHFDLGRAYVRRSQPDDAVTAFARAVELNPQPMTQNNAAYQLALAGAGLDRAVAWSRASVDATLAELRDISLDTPSQQALPLVFRLSSYWDTLGWILFRQGDLENAERYVRAASMLRSGGEIGEHLGEIYERRGRSADARIAYAIAAGSRPPSQEAHRRLTKMVGSADRADELVRDVRVTYLKQRTFPLGTATEDVNINVQILMTPAGITDVRRTSGTPLTGALARRIRGVKLTSLFPDTASVKIPRHAAVICSSGQCNLSLYELGTGPDAVDAPRRMR